jgi:ATP-dependent protease Clp ATPase subunit
MNEIIYQAFASDDVKTLITYCYDVNKCGYMGATHKFRHLYTMLIDCNSYNCIQYLLDNNILFNYNEERTYTYKFCEKIFDYALRKGDCRIIEMIDKKRKTLTTPISNQKKNKTKPIEEKKENIEAKIMTDLFTPNTLSTDYIFEKKEGGLTSVLRGMEIEKNKKVTSQNLRAEAPVFNINNEKEIKLQKLNEMNLPSHNYDMIKEKINNCNSFDKSQSWINELFKIPFGKYSNLPINKNNSMKEIRDYVLTSKFELDKIAYGMENVKEEIIDIVCQLIRSPNSNIKVIGLCGSPGIGKTNFIKNGLSKILQRPFQHICMGGITDSSYLIGHEMSYNNSRYGIMVNCLMNSKVMNPIIFMDELDKISRTDKGVDVENVLIHLTDPVQNMSFMDKYFQGIEIDMSKVMFVFSFNDEYKISPILRDRMHIIHVQDPTEKDKIEIARQFLMPSLLENIMLENVNEVNVNVLRKIIKDYCSEEKGVRELKRCLEKLLMKINTSIYSGNKYKTLKNISIEEGININEKMIEEILERNDKFKSYSMMYI